jgi:hypothetical protein
MPKAGMLIQMDSSQHRWIEDILGGVVNNFVSPSHNKKAGISLSPLILF